MRSLKRTCRRRKYKLEVIKSCYRSVISPVDGCELLITTPEKKYCVKFFTCLRYKDTYTFADVGHYTTESNAGMTLVNMNPFTSGMGRKDPSLAIEHFHRVENEGMNEMEIIGGETDDAPTAYPDAEMILCVNPIPVEMRCVKGSTTVQMFDGDVLDGYTVYSGKALLTLLGK